MKVSGQSLVVGFAPPNQSQSRQFRVLAATGSAHVHIHNHIMIPGSLTESPRFKANGNRLDVPFFLPHVPSEAAAMSIAQRHRDCHLSFQELCEAARSSEQCHHTLLDEFDKYCLWAGNVGATHSGADRLSLDYRLREASFYKDQVPHVFLLDAKAPYISQWAHMLPI